MSPLGGVILSVLLLSGIMTVNKSYESIGVPAAIWYLINGVLVVLLIAQEIRAHRKKDRSSD